MGRTPSSVPPPSLPAPAPCAADAEWVPRAVALLAAHIADPSPTVCVWGPGEGQVLGERVCAGSEGMSMMYDSKCSNLPLTRSGQFFAKFSDGCFTWRETTPIETDFSIHLNFHVDGCRVTTSERHCKNVYFFVQKGFYSLKGQI